MNWLIVGLLLTIVVAGTSAEDTFQKQMPVMNGYMPVPRSGGGGPPPGNADDYDDDGPVNIAEGVEELSEFLEGLYVTIQRRKIESTAVIIGVTSALGAAIQALVTMFMTLFGVLSFLMLKDFLRKNGMTVF